MCRLWRALEASLADVSGSGVLVNLVAETGLGEGDV